MSLIIKILNKAFSVFYPANAFSKWSFSQDGEDVILDAFYEDMTAYKGFYVDIGAHHPFRFSNTYMFYRRGWRGINIDATPGSMAPFRKHRKNDTNIEVGVGREPGKLTFHCFNEPALNTFDPDLAAERNGRSGWKIINKVEVDILPLDSLLDKHLPKGRVIDFLSIDVEGHDLDVLKSNNWKKYRPRFVLAEALTEGESSAIVDFLVAQGYSGVGRSKRTAIFKDNTTDMSKLI